MKLNKLKQIIKEEILGEIKVNRPLNNKDAFKNMIDGPMGSFAWGDNFEEWRTEYINNYDEEPNSETVDLAKIFYQWLANGDVILLHMYHRDEFLNTKLTKPYKNLYTYGDNDNGVLVILTTF
jgi:hypothetical protein